MNRRLYDFLAVLATFIAIVLILGLVSRLLTAKTVMEKKALEEYQEATNIIAAHVFLTFTNREAVCIGNAIIFRFVDEWEWKKLRYHFPTETVTTSFYTTNQP